jgi:predicted O-methyltransferase YrrM
VNEELEEMILDFLDKAGIRDKVKLLIGDARVLIPQLDRDFELIFIDANKEHYPQYYQVCMEALSPGGIIIADNVLWGGKVVHEPRLDESTRKLHEFNTLVKEDPRVENVFLTVRDGLMLIKKK